MAFDLKYYIDAKSCEVSIIQDVREYNLESVLAKFQVYVSLCHQWDGPTYIKYYANFHRENL